MAASGEAQQAGAMPAPESLAQLAGLLADRSRAAMCLALLDGRAWTAGELATVAGVARSTASEHLTALVGSGLLAQERQGRHRYVRLAGPHVARLVEDLAGAAGGSGPPPPASLRAVRASRELAEARTCYDHLAGRLGVDVLDAMVARGLLLADGGLTLTDDGRAWADDVLGPDALPRNGSRPVVRSCLDWTERRPHLAGALAAVLLTELLRREWLQRTGSGRALRVTADGTAGLEEILGLGVR